MNQPTPPGKSTSRQYERIWGSFFVLTRFKDAGDDGPTQKEISHVLVRLSPQGTLKLFDASFNAHAKKNINPLTNSQPQIPSVLLKLNTQQRGTAK